MKPITQYTIQELKSMKVDVVTRLLPEDLGRQNLSLYLRLCRLYEGSIDQLRFIASEVPSRRLTNGGSTEEFLKIAREHALEVEKVTEARHKLLDQDLMRILELEQKLSAVNPDFERYELPERKTSFVNSDVNSDLEEDDLVEDIYIKANEIITTVEAFLPSLDKEERREITQKIKTPLKTAITNRNEKIVIEKTRELEAILNKD